jgi:hypothetical protein
MGGSDDPSNLVKLTVDEHEEAHRILHEQHGKQQDLIAYRMLKGQITNSEAVRLARKYRDTSYMQTEEYRQKISKANKNKMPWNKGKVGVQTHTKEHKLKMSEMYSGGNNPKAKPFLYCNVEYSTLKKCAEINNITIRDIKKHTSFQYLVTKG